MIQTSYIKNYNINHYFKVDYISYLIPTLILFKLIILFISSNFALGFDTTAKSAIVYDIIYEPKYTELLERANKLGLKTINGLRMNMIQAVLAYAYTNETALSKEEILKIMSE